MLAAAQEAMVSIERAFTTIKSEAPAALPAPIARIAERELALVPASSLATTAPRARPDIPVEPDRSTVPAKQSPTAAMNIMPGHVEGAPPPSPPLAPTQTNVIPLFATPVVISDQPSTRHPRRRQWRDQRSRGPNPREARPT